MTGVRFGLLALVICGMSVLAHAEALRIPKAGHRSVVEVDPGRTNRISVSFEVPIVDIQQMWTPDRERPLLERKWWVSFAVGPQRDMPYLAFFNINEENVFSFGSESLGWDNLIDAKINQERGVYEVLLTVASGEGRTLRPFKITMDRRKVPWTAALADWRLSLHHGKGRYPEAAWRPVFCSWYAAHAAITQEWVERTAEIAADLGFGTFILDDGWSYDEGKRVNPETLKTWYRDVGKWDSFSKAKFPDFKTHRERMRRTGLKYVVWVAPYFIGTRTDAFRRWGFDRRPDLQQVEGNVLADVANAGMMDDVVGQLETLLSESDLDGLKIDFLDSVPPSTEEPRGAVALDFMEGMMKRLRMVKPEGLFEFRQSYATPITARLGTQFRAGDVPFEWLSNLQRIAQIRLAMGDGIPIHADPICWARGEKRDNINRHFMAAMAGVPMLSMDLKRMSDEEKSVVRFWLQYYVKHVEPFQRSGKWDVVYKNGGIAYVISECAESVLTIVNDPDVVKKVETRIKGRRSVVLNLTYESIHLESGIVVPPARAWPDAMRPI